jgi:beta-phosphoglucomutase-like phosphatase (HAD superfamily)
MPLRIAFDLDGTLADMHAVLRREAKRLFDAAVLPQPGGPEATSGSDEPEAAKVMDEMHLTASQQTELWQHVRTIENFWGGLPEMEPGIVARIAQTATSRRWEILFLTTRPLVAGETTQLQSQRWLQAHGFPLPSVFVVQRSRGKIAEALELDAVVDDRPENCVDVAVDSKAKPILIWPGDLHAVPARAKRLGVRTVTSISEALALLVQLDDLKHDRSVVRSIKKFFGKESVS